MLMLEQDVFCKRPSAQAVYCLLQVIILFASVITCSNINITEDKDFRKYTEKKMTKAIIPSNSVLKQPKTDIIHTDNFFHRTVLFILITT